MSYTNLPNDISTNVNDFYDSLKQLEDNILPLCQLKDADLSDLSSLEKARAYSLLSYIINSLYYSIIFYLVYLNTNGESGDNSPILKDIERVSTYLNRIKQLANPKSIYLYY